MMQVVHVTAMAKAAFNIKKVLMFIGPCIIVIAEE